MLAPRLSCLTAVLLAGCAHVSSPAATVAAADPELARMVGAHAGRAPLLFVLRPGELTAGHAPLTPLLKAADVPTSLVSALAGGQPARLVEQLVRMMIPEARRGLTRLEGLDTSRPLLLALFEPTVPSPVIAALDPSVQSAFPFAIRHRVVLPAADPKRLLTSLDSLSPEPPALSGDTHVLALAGLPAIAATPHADRVVLTWLDPEMVFGDAAISPGAPARRVVLARQAAAALLAPVPAEVDTGSASMQRLVSDGAALAATVRPVIARDARVLAQATSVSQALANVNVRSRAALLAKGTAEVLLSWMTVDPQHAEISGLGVAVKLTPVLHLTIAAPLTASGRRTMDAAFTSGRADTSGCCSLPVVEGALLSAAAELDTGNYTRGIPALLPRGESPTSVDEIALMVALIARPAAMLRELQIELGGRTVLPHAAAMSLTGIGSPPHAQGELSLLLPPSGSRRNEVLSALEELSSVVRANGGNVAMSSKPASSGDLTLATVTADLDPAARRDVTTSPGLLLRAAAQPAKLASLLRAAGLDDRDLLVLLDVAGHFDRLRASLRVRDGVLAGELAATPPGHSLQDVPVFTPPAGGPTASAAPAAGASCLATALVELRQTLDAVTNVDPSMTGSLLRSARQEIAAPFACAGQDPETRDVVRAVERLLERLAAAADDAAKAASEGDEQRSQPLQEEEEP